MQKWRNAKKRPVFGMFAMRGINIQGCMHNARKGIVGPRKRHRSQNQGRFSLLQTPFSTIFAFSLVKMVHSFIAIQFYAFYFSFFRVQEGRGTCLSREVFCNKKSSCPLVFFKKLHIIIALRAY